MSNTAPSRPKPKPRPRPRPVNAQPVPSGNAPGSSNAATGNIPLGEIVINDSDDFFIINRGRTKETRKKLDDNNKVAVRVTPDAESDAEPSTPLRKRSKRQGTPKWQNNENALRLLSIEISSDSDSDIEIQSNIPGKGKGKRVPSSPNKRKRQKDRSRSRSITPPPEVPAAILANARNVIRQALEIPRAPSPIPVDDFDESTDTIVLDPELERIAKAVASQSTSAHAASGTGEKLTVRVKWQRHPLNPGEPEPTWSYAMSRDESFLGLFDTIADEAQILVASLILSYRNKRIYPSTRPDALGLWGEVEFVGCQERTYNYLIQQAREARHTQIPEKSISNDDAESDNQDAVHIISDDSDDRGDEEDNNTATVRPSATGLEASQESDAESESDSEKFKLVLRSSKVPKDITLIVRPKTTCGAIIRTYIKKAGLTAEYPHIFDEGTTGEVAPPQVTRGRGRGRGKGRGKGKAQAPVRALPDPRISVDGDRMENNVEIGTADLEDGDMVEVVGL